MPGDALVAQGRCLPYGEGITYWPVAEVVRELAQVADDDPVSELSARLAGRLSGEADAELVAAKVAAAVGLGDGEVAKEEAFWAFRRLLEALAREQPVVVVFDDIQWGRRPSSTCSSTSSNTPATRASCSSAWRGRSCSTSGRAGATEGPMRRRCTWSRCPARPAACSSSGSSARRARRGDPGEPRRAFGRQPVLRRGDGRDALRGRAARARERPLVARGRPRAAHAPRLHPGAPRGAPRSPARRGAPTARARRGRGRGVPPRRGRRPPGSPISTSPCKASSASSSCSLRAARSPAPTPTASATS